MSTEVAEKKSKKSSSGKNAPQMTTLTLRQIKMPSDDIIVRRDNGDIATLQRDIKRHGLINPLTVRPAKKGYELLTGHRRFAACKNLGLDDVAVVIREDLSDDTKALGFIMAENSEDTRTTPTAIEQAAVFARMFKKLKEHKKVALECGCSSEHVRRSLMLLDASESLQKKVHSGDVSAELVIRSQQIPDKEMKAYAQKAIQNGEITTVSDLDNAKITFASERADKGGDDEVEEASTPKVSLRRTMGDIRDAAVQTAQRVHAAREAGNDAEVVVLEAMLMAFLWADGMTVKLDLLDGGILKHSRARKFLDRFVAESIEVEEEADVNDDGGDEEGEDE